MLDLIGLVLFGIVKVLPAKVAMPVIAGIFLVLGIIAFVWHGHLSAAVAFCNSGEGRFSQLLNGSATVDCGLDSLLSLATLIAGVVLVLIALAPTGVWIYQLTHPNFDLKEFADDAL